MANLLILMISINCAMSLLGLKNSIRLFKRSGLTNAELTRASLVLVGRRLGVPELAVPRRLEKVAAIPLLGSGKTDYQTLKRWTQEAE